MKSGGDVEVIIDVAGLEALLRAVQADGRTLVGPRLRDGAIVYEPLSGVDDLPRGWTERQEAGRYRLERRDDGALFGFTVGPHAWKKLLFPPEVSLFQVRRSADGLAIQRPTEPPPRYAFLGVRACDLAAIGVQDRVFVGGPYKDPIYEDRRDAIILAVNCTEAGGTCFCVSMATGPRAREGFDLALTERVGPGEHVFLVEVGTPRGRALLDAVPHRPATDPDRAAAQEGVDRAASSMGRSLAAATVRDLLLRNLESPHWDDVARRCLACANCTLVCPTCFCHTVEDVISLDGAQAERQRRWDSCFNAEHSYVHGGVVHSSIKSRYRQWLTHKLATWHDQFGTSGCVGCGRCITWCPVGIDLTAEVRAIEAAPP